MLLILWNKNTSENIIFFYLTLVTKYYTWQTWFEPVKIMITNIIRNKDHKKSNVYTYVAYVSCYNYELVLSISSSECLK